MVGRPPKDNKKVREAIYFEPELIEWLREKAEERKCTVSVLVNVLVEEKMKTDGQQK